MGVEEQHHQFTRALVLLRIAHTEGVGGEVGGGLADGAQEHDEGEVEVLDAVGVLTELRRGVLTVVFTVVSIVFTV